MELNLSKEDAVFRDELRTFVAENYPTEMRVPNPETDLTKEQSLLWHRILYKTGSPRRGQRNMEARVGPSHSVTFSNRRPRAQEHCLHCRSASPW
jgi:hypothetical protein